jgi:hypothetical protein
MKAYSEDGMGREVLLAFLHAVPGINAGSLQHQFANLKASGDSARLIADSEQEIAEEEAATQTTLEEAERAWGERAKARRTVSPSVPHNEGPHTAASTPRP